MSGTGTNNNENHDNKEGQASGTQDQIEAKGQTGSAEGGDKGDDLGDFADPAKALAEIKKLRAENAKHRTKNKSLEEQLGSMNGTLGKLKEHLGIKDDEEDPQTVIQNLKKEKEMLEVEIGLGSLAREHGIARDQEAYFRFLMSQKFEQLEEGAELTDEDIESIVQEVQKVSGAQKRQSTGVGSGAANPAGNNDGLTLEQFVKMGVGEKSQLYTKNPDLYSRLFSEAQQKGFLK